MTKQQKLDNKKLVQILKTELNNAIYVGEDGYMAVSCKTKLGALRKFRKLMREYVGEQEASGISLEDISIGYLHLTTEEYRNEWGDEYEWVINYTTKSPYPVFISTA